MKKNYAYQIEGRDADDRKWVGKGIVACEFMHVFHQAMLETTRDMPPGLRCPHTVLRVLIARTEEKG